jgi:hypothetical protein
MGNASTSGALDHAVAAPALFHEYRNLGPAAQWLCRDRLARPAAGARLDADGVDLSAQAVLHLVHTAVAAASQRLM